MKFLAYVSNFLFERSMNLFDVLLFSVIWHHEFSLFDWQFWLILIPGLFASAFFTQVNERLQLKVKISKALGNGK